LVKDEKGNAVLISHHRQSGAKELHGVAAAAAKEEQARENVLLLESFHHVGHQKEVVFHFSPT
jgi:hypothetical protein